MDYLKMLNDFFIFVNVRKGIIMFLEIFFENIIYIIFFFYVVIYKIKFNLKILILF